MSKYCSECGKPMEENNLFVALVVDKSGSMHELSEEVIHSINNYVKTQQVDDGKTWVKLVLFDTTISQGAALPVEMFEPLTSKSYVAGGCTSLNDAIGVTIKSIEKEVKAFGNTKVALVIMTDGYENSSHNYTTAQIKELIQSKENEGWAVIYLGANQDAFAVGGAIGVNHAMAANWDFSAQGVRAGLNGSSVYTRDFRYGNVTDTVSTYVSNASQTVEDDEE